VGPHFSAMARQRALIKSGQQRATGACRLGSNLRIPNATHTHTLEWAEQNTCRQLMHSEWPLQVEQKWSRSEGGETTTVTRTKQCSFVALFRPTNVAQTRFLAAFLGHTSGQTSGQWRQRLDQCSKRRLDRRLDHCLDQCSKRRLDVSLELQLARLTQWPVVEQQVKRVEWH